MDLLQLSWLVGRVRPSEWGLFYLALDVNAPILWTLRTSCEPSKLFSMTLSQPGSSASHQHLSREAVLLVVPSTSSVSLSPIYCAELGRWWAEQSAELGCSQCRSHLRQGTTASTTHYYDHYDTVYHLSWTTITSPSQHQSLRLMVRKHHTTPHHAIT